MKLLTIFQQIEKSFDFPFTPCITLGLQYLPPFDQDRFLQNLSQIEPLKSAVQIEIQEDKSTQTLLGVIKFEEHSVMLLGNAAGFSEKVQKTCILTAHWQEPFQRAILSARATITLAYAGSSHDPVENYLSLYKVAASLDTAPLLGIVNEPAWTYHPAIILHKIVHHQPINLCRNCPPFLFWTGFLKTSLAPSPTQSCDFFFTKGHHVFGVPDLAIHQPPPNNPLIINQLFNELIHYAWAENKDLLPGDTLHINEHETYELVEPEENLPILESPTKTLVLKKMD